MSETNETSKFAALEDHRPLADSELDAVTGGAFPIVVAQMAMAAKATMVYRDFSDPPQYF